MAPAFIEFNRRLRWADSDAAGRLHFPRIFEIIEEAESEPAAWNRMVDERAAQELRFPAPRS
jgi:acyl-CoA thioesterase FadM